MPIKSSVLRSISSTCFNEVTAISGAHGEQAIARTAAPRVATTGGSNNKSRGIGGGPSGLAPPAPFMALLNFGALGLRAVEFAFSSNPPSIHALMIATCGAPSASPSGGIFGSAVRMMLVRIFEEASPGSAIFPPDPPFMAALNEERSRPPLVLSGLWQFRHDCWKIGNT